MIAVHRDQAKLLQDELQLSLRCGQEVRRYFNDACMGVPGALEKALMAAVSMQSASVHVITLVSHIRGLLEGGESRA